jgi:hypothetical protein
MSPAKLQLPDWMPSDAQETWILFYDLLKSDNSAREARYMLQRLATQPMMKDAWAELKYFDGVQPSIVVSATLSTWNSAMRNHPLGGGAAPNTRRSFRELANCARTVADAMKTVDPATRAENEITDVSLTELNRVATFLNREAALIDKLVNIAPFSRKQRARNAHQIAFVNRMCHLFMQPTGRRPYTLVAILTNVAFNVPADKQWDADRVKHCYRSRSRNVREH